MRRLAISRSRLLFGLIGLLFLTRKVVLADGTGAYRNNGNAVKDNSDWMANLPDGSLLSVLSLPGTHDSGSYNFGGETTETQSMNVAEQLRAGIRALDIRLGNSHLKLNKQCKGPNLWTFHGISCQFETFQDILTAVQKFLAEHPKETIVMRVREENGNNPSFPAIVQAEMDSFPDLFYGGDDMNPTVGEIRGKIVLLPDYEGSERGIPWQSLNIQDQFRISSNWALARKWNLVRDQFIQADNAPMDLIYVNFLSATGGSFPYFVAGGKSSWETHAPALLSGWTDGFWPFNSCSKDENCIDEFYRVNCALRVCSVAFKGINIMARDFIEESVQSRTGLVMADFPGDSLISAIIDRNSFVSTQSG